jgi:hypothetical protein
MPAAAAALSVPAPSTRELFARSAHSAERDPARAIGALNEQLAASDANAVLLFCSAGYDLERLGSSIARTFRAPVLACTSAGQIGPRGFERGGITALSLHGPDLEMRLHLLSPLSLCKAQAVSLARQHAARMARRPGARSFGLLLVDGLSLCEEYVAEALYESLGNVPVVGGSAAPGPSQPEPAVYYDGRFIKGAGVLGLCETESVLFDSFAAQHFVPSRNKLVITLADAERRIIYEINGEPAARSYAAALGLNAHELGAREFACHPLLLELGEQRLPRAIRHQNEDGSFTMACAIDEGLVVSIAESRDPVAVLERALNDVRQRVPNPAALIVFDCVVRRLELEARGVDQQVGELLASRRAVGFSSYGEQLGPLHANHTLIGLALGSAQPGALG